MMMSITLSRAIVFPCPRDLLIRDGSLLPAEPEKSVDGFAPVPGPVEADEVFGIFHKVGPRLEVRQRALRLLGDGSQSLPTPIIS